MTVVIFTPDLLVWFAVAALVDDVGYSQPNNKMAVVAPRSCAQIKPGVSAGRMPLKVLLAARARVTAGLAKEVEAVNQ